MTLLSDIIDDATGDTPVNTLLRKLKVLGSRTGAGVLDEWVSHELNGYPGSANLPDYRGPLEAVVLGHFLGRFGAEMINVPIPPSTFPEDLRDGALFNFWFRQPVAEIEDMTRSDSINFPWPPDAVLYYNYSLRSGRIKRIVREDMSLATATRPVARQYFAAIVDAVRNRVLDLCLELEGHSKLSVEAR